MFFDLIDTYQFRDCPSQDVVFSSPMIQMGEFDSASRSALLLSLADDFVPESTSVSVTSVVTNPAMLPGVEIFQPDAIVRVKEDAVVVSSVHDDVFIPKYAVMAYLANDLFLSNRKLEAYYAMMALKIAPYIDIPHANNDHTDGQLKILVDFVLGVDSCLARNPTRFRASGDPIRILIIGSASESGVSGVAYHILDFMGIFFDIELWDPYECEGVSKSTFGVYRRHRGLWNYGAVNSERLFTFDIVFDDAFVNREHNRSDLDPERTVLCARDFSVKWLANTADDKYFSGINCYHQASNLVSLERRGVKYPRVYHHFKNLFAGKCAFCAELKYILQLQYDACFFDYVLRAHKKCCVIGVDVFSRAVVMKNECCVRSQCSTPPLVKLQCGHSSSLSLTRVKNLSPERVLYAPQFDLNERDYRRIVVRDLFLMARRFDGVIYVNANYVASVIATNIVIQVDEYFLVTRVRSDEVRVACQDVIIWRYDLSTLSIFLPSAPNCGQLVVNNRKEVCDVFVKKK